MFKIVSNNSIRKYKDARGVAKDIYYRELRAKKTTLSLGEGIKFYMGFIGENIHNENHCFSMIAGGKTIYISYEK